MPPVLAAGARFVWGAPPPFAMPATPVVAPRPGKVAAVQVVSTEDYPVPVISLPNEGVVSLRDAAPLELDGAYSLASDADPIVSWSWALRMISPQEVDMTEQVQQEVSEPTASISLSVPGSYVVGLTVESESGLAHWNNSALIVLAGDVPVIGGGGGAGGAPQEQPGGPHQPRQPDPGVPAHSQFAAPPLAPAGSWAAPPPCVFDPVTQTLINCRIRFRCAARVQPGTQALV